MKEIIAFLAMIICLASCKEDPPANPFDVIGSYTNDSTMIDSIYYASNSIIALQHNVFSPTCANSGCHDGTFEPDFRTIESSYNTLINHPIIKNDPAESFKYRVVPYSSSESVLLTRVLIDIDGQSGIMPLEFQETDWQENKEKYIQDIREWIENGAPDVLGKPYSPIDNKPRTLGVIAKYNNSNLLRGDAGNGPILVPSSADEIQIFIALSDDNTDIHDLNTTRLRFSKGPINFDSSLVVNLSVMGSSFTDKGFTGDDVEYTFQANINFNVDTLFNLNQIYFRVNSDDGVNGNIEAPSESSALYLKRYFSILK